MSDDSWMPPGSSSSPERPEDAPVVVPAPPPVQMPTVGYPSAAPPPANPYQYPGADAAENWGVAYPGYGAVGYAVLVPRPPQPQVVRLAVIGTYVGVLLSGVQMALTSLWIWGQRDEFSRSVAENGSPDAPDLTGLTNTAFSVGIILSAVFWLLPAVGAVICAVLTGRGKNAARIVLACLTGLFALNGLCGAGSGLLFQWGNAARATTPFGGPAGGPWWAILFQFSLGVLAVVICVLLLLPVANRYFSAGPGRRFAPST